MTLRRCRHSRVERNASYIEGPEKVVFFGPFSYPFWLHRGGKVMVNPEAASLLWAVFYNRERSKP